MSITQNYGNKQCKIEGCSGIGTLDKNGKRYFIKGLCKAHYIKWFRYGTPHPITRFSPRPAIIKGDIALIPLGMNAQEGYAIVDKEFAHLADDYKWHNNGGYPTTNFNNNGFKMMQIHHLIIGKPPKGLVTDHINRNPLDNRLTNLRHVTQSVNTRNVDMRKSNTSGHKNISWSNTKSNWRVKINVKCATVYDKRFNTLPEAIAARDKFLSTLNEPSVL